MNLADRYPLVAADRRLTIGSTDARRIAAGEWLDLYREKIGEVAPADLTYVWKPRLGKCTEDLHAWWHGFQTKDIVSEGHNKGDRRFTRPGLPSHHATSIDRWIYESLTLPEMPVITLEMKHTNERASLRSSAEFYMAQLQWQLYVLDHKSLRFSIIRGNNDPEWGEVERDEEYIAKLVAQVDSFWECVMEREPPEDLGPTAAAKELKAAAAAVKINGMRSYDMEGNNEWATRASAYVLDKVASEGLKTSEAAIKAMVPADAAEIGGHGVSFKRDARGALRVTISDEVRDYAEKRLAALIATQETA